MVAYEVTVALRPDEIDNGRETVDLQVEAPDKEKPIRHVRMLIDVTAEKLEVNPKIQEVPKENA